MNKELLDFFKNKDFKILWPEDFNNHHLRIVEEKQLSESQLKFIANLIEIVDKYNFEIFGHTNVYTDDFNKDTVKINLRPKSGFSGLKTKLFVYQF